jgi:hypothetical protein
MRAYNGTRTHDLALTKGVLYQLSYVGNQVGRAGLEPAKAAPADLQSAPFAARDTDPIR